MSDGGVYESRLRVKFVLVVVFSDGFSPPGFPVRFEVYVMAFYGAFFTILGISFLDFGLLETLETEKMKELWCIA